MTAQKSFLLPVFLWCLWLPFSAAAQNPIDFSYAGFEAGEHSLPFVPARIAVRPTGSDDTTLLQAALDHVAALPIAEDGFRGAVLLRAGRYRVSGHLEMRTSGVVLRGSESVVIVAAGISRRTLIEIGESGEPVMQTAAAISVEGVPAGAFNLTVANADSFHSGDRVVITRPSTLEWIDSLHMRGLPGNYANMRIDWTPGSRNLTWDRTVVAINSRTSQISFDAPITTALERRFGGGTVALVSSQPPPAHIGIENLTLESEFASGNSSDEEHAWIAIALDHVEDAWVRDVTARHFADSAVRVGSRARRITVEKCRSEQPVSEPAGYRRQSFLVYGQQVLVRDSTSEQGMNDFAVGALAAGPNVFLNSTAEGSLGPSGAFESWASGVLYENMRVHGSGIRLTNDSARAQGAGWTAANSVVWNCQADSIDAKGPEGAESYAKQSPEPLYETQLFKRLGHKIAPVAFPQKEMNVSEFRAPAAATPAPKTVQAIEIVNGRFVANGKTIWGGMVDDGWWRGLAIPGTSVDAGGFSLTRFVPGETGPGLTEDLNSLVGRMTTNGTPFYQAVPGLWYDRRRDEHSIVARSDSNVWAPFYEMPWARTGNGKAADGLSLYDLTKFNPWYFDRIADFGRLSDTNGFVFYYNLYNTHNVLEIPQHFFDYPWRAANNINNTGLPEPLPIETGNHLHLANEVYDISQPVRRELHRAFILHNLDQLGDIRNLFFGLGFQFAGPLAFQEFFQDTVAEWEKRTGKTVRITLTTSKEITDAILASPSRAKQVAVIDMLYWQYRPDGSLFAPRSGQNLAFRELISKEFPRSGGDTPDATTPLEVYRQVREYHDRYPDKAIVAWNGGAGPIPVLMAGGAQAIMRNPAAGHGAGRFVDHTPFDTFVQNELSGILMHLQPRDGVAANPDQNWCMTDEHDDAVLLYSLAGDSIQLQKALAQLNYTGLWFDPRSGATHPFSDSARPLSIAKPSTDPWMLLLRKL